MKRICMTILASLIIIGFAVSSKADYNGRVNQVWSVAPKLIIFFPNGSNPGLNNFGPGVGVGVDGRYNFMKYFAVSAELDYLGVSSANINGATENFSNFAIKVDALGTIPLGKITPFFGLGPVYNSPSISVSGGGYSTSISGSGIGLEIVGGADFLVTHNGAVTVEISLPISESATFNGSSTSVDVGSYELMGGYRFLF
ncbi:MAG: porin family protein [Deltaproteobacteria bacterium]|nr:porin family protein [Deltaproteobacteria bacterium]MCL5792374.1 porin family protein [Deltaproteobacteria bacterium]